MELLLWLYLFDNRWFFKFNIPIAIYRLLWLIPLTAHLLGLAISIHDLNISSPSTCLDSRNMLLYNQILFSSMISLNIIIFMKQISKEHKKENVHIERGREAYPILKSIIHDPDFWIRRNSLSSIAGLFLLIQSFISFIWSYMTIYKAASYSTCNTFINKFINAHCYFTLFSNIFVLIVFGLLIAIKLSFNILGHYSPRTLVKISKLFYRSRKNIRIHHHTNNPFNFSK